MYKLLLCLRYLKTRYIAMACIISVMLGVATMIVVNSVMAGFAEEMQDRIKGILADVVVESNSIDGVINPERHMEMIDQVAGEYIEAMTPTVEVYGMLSFQYTGGEWITRPVTLIGIDPRGKAQVGPLIDYLVNTKSLTDRATGWELSEEVMNYRREWASRQAWMQAHALGQQQQQRILPAEATSTDEAPPFESSAPAPNFDIAETGPQGTEPPPFAESATQNPFENQPIHDSAKPVDPVEPLDGRLYVGMGLISYPYEDKSTGEVKTLMMVRPGDDVKISTVTAGRPPEPAHFNATIVDVFKSGMSEYDSSLIFCNLEYLQRVRGMIDPTSKAKAITSIQIKLKDYANADEVVDRLSALFPPGVYTVRTWEQKQGPLLAAVEVESAILNVLLFLIIAVAGFGILAIFFMIVVEKTRDIGILKALGASSQGVMTVFLSYGLALGIVGSGVGVIVGLLFVRYINVIEACLSWMRGRKVFDERIYYFPEIPTSVNPWMVFCVALGAMTIAVLAGIMPARRAARLHPVEALRYE